MPALASIWVCANPIRNNPVPARGAAGRTFGSREARAVTMMARSENSIPRPNRLMRNVSTVRSKFNLRATADPLICARSVWRSGTVRIGPGNVHSSDCVKTCSNETWPVTTASSSPASSSPMPPSRTLKSTSFCRLRAIDSDAAARILLQSYQHHGISTKGALT